jgi:hypothetical protein
MALPSPAAADSNTSNAVFVAIESEPIVMETISFGSAPRSCVDSSLTLDVVA